ncbi:MAG: amidohydrolase family protein [Blautia sp.]|nr:amidohydrolase family protein [Blautia sp.]
MAGITDMHCHILPGLDDGSQSMEETLASLREAVRQGIDRMIVTPHFHPERYMVYAPDILSTLEQVKNAASEAGIRIELYPGQECYYYSGLTEMLDREEALTLCGTRYVLVEFDPSVSWTFLQNGIRNLRQAGYIPVIAHFERYECLNEEKRVEELHRHQYLLQMNYDTLLLRGGLFGDSYWRRLFKKGYVDFLGSDTHGTHFRPLHVDKALHWILNKTEPQLAHRIIQDNFDRIIYD